MSSFISATKMTAIRDYEHLREGDDAENRRHQFFLQLRELKEVFEQSSRELPYRKEILAFLSAAEVLMLPETSGGTKEERREEILRSLGPALNSLDLTIKAQQR
jgi:hypothetical protein